MPAADHVDLAVMIDVHRRTGAVGRLRIEIVAAELEISGKSNGRRVKVKVIAAIVRRMCIFVSP